MHYLTKLTGKLHAAASLDESGLNLQNLTADLGPGQTGCQSHFALRSDALLAELNWSKHLANSYGVNGVFGHFAGLLGNKLARKLAATGANLAL